jgi:hypothetical protein
MSNDANRMLIVLVAAATIVLMSVLIFLTWTADTDVIDKVGDLSEYLDAHNDDAGKMIITLSALIVVVLSLLMIIMELAPEDEEKELRVKQAGATTIVPAAALKGRIEEALVALPEVTAAKAKVNTKDNGIATALDLTLVPGANISAVTQDSARVVTDTIQTDLGLPVAGIPTVRVTYGDGKKQPVASSVSRGPTGGEPAPGPTDEPIAPEVSVPPVPVTEPATPVPEPPPPPPSWTQQPSAEAETPNPPTPAPEAAPDPETQTEADSDVSRDPWRQT